MSSGAAPVRQQGAAPAPAGPEGGDCAVHVLLNTPEGPRVDFSSPAGDDLARAYGEVLEKMAAEGVLVDCAPLAPLEAATTVRVRHGETLMSDGPAAEIKEWLGGYTIVQCADLDDALRWAALMPAAHNASVEVRPILDRVS